MGIHIFFLVLYASLSGAFDAITICSLLIVHCVLKLIIDIRAKKRGLHVMTTFYIGVAITTFANLYHINKINTQGLGDFSMYWYIVLKYIDDGIKLWAIGNTFIFIGYELFAKTSLPSVMLEIKDPKNVTRLYHFIVAFSLLNFTGTAVNFAFITGGIQKVLSLLNIMGILFYARLWVVEDSKKYRNHAIVLALLQTFIALSTSYLRLDLLTPALSFFGGYFIGKGSIKYLLSYRIVPLAAVLVVFSLVFNTLAGNRAHFLTTFTGEGGNVSDNTSYTDLSENDYDRGNVLDRTSNIAQITNVVDLVRKNGTYNGAASFPLMAALVPRFLWPDKPQIQLGAWFALEIGAATLTSAGRANNSINMTVPGELYLDFGWLGIIFGGIAFGAMMAVFWNAARFAESPFNLSGALWGGYLLLYALFGIGADLQIVVSLISTYLIFFILKKVAKPYASSVDRSALAGQ